MTNLLSIAVRLLTPFVFVARRQLKQNQKLWVGLLENNPKMFWDFTLTSVRLPGQIILHVTPLLAVRTRILEPLGLSPDVYSQLAEN